MKYIIILLFAFFSISCGTYTMTSYYGNEVENVLAITKAGDTIQVPIREFNRYKYDNYTRFQWNENWYWNNWLYNNNIYGYYNFYRPRGFNYWNWHNSTPSYGSVNRYIPKSSSGQTRVRVNTPRGSNNNNNSRVRTTPNVQNTPSISRGSRGRGCSKC